MKPSNSKWPFKIPETPEAEPSHWAGIWQSLVQSGLRAPILRYAGHFLILVIVALAAWLARPALWDWLPAQINFNTSGATPTDLPQFSSTSALPVLPTTINAESISRLINFRTYMPDQPRTDVITYLVQSGDSLFGIADKFNLQPETLLWSNYGELKDNPDFLTPGQNLYILPVDGVYYQWQAGGKLDVIADNFGVSVEDIVSWPGNNLDLNIDPENPDIAPGSWLVIPGGHRAFQQWQVPVLRRTDTMKWIYGGPGACQGPFLSSVQGNGYFIWPTTSHNTSLGNQYGPFHHAIDIAAGMDSPVYASDSGVIVFSGWSDWGYGNLLVIDHGNGWQTVYAHLDYGNILVGCGADVYRGDVIAYSGTSGNSTGPHLHFEMSYNGAPVNPLTMLP